ncbi:MAG TPA: NTP transferase domain-containing protein [Candidatus Binatia bacterium]|nr:NTP transferase domain-containing protein [Candidatus Binatia bacterium]
MFDETEGARISGPRVRALVLAAGTGERFGGGKLAARIDGQPVLRHVLDAVAAAGLGRPALVLGPEDPPGVDLGGTTIVRNPNPAAGLSSSLRIGWRSAASTWPLEAAPPDAVLVVLGDQPLLRPDVLVRLAAEPLDPDRPIVAARYAGTGARMPVRIEATAAGLVEAATGDRGLGPVIDANPDQVRWVEVDGDNPDVDTPGDLARVAELLWAARVRGNREQVDRFREEADGADFYARVSSIFRDDPDRTGDPVLDALREHARPDETWLDIGAGAGRYALPVARSVRRVIALDPSPSMLDGLRAGMAEHGIENVDVVQARWPDAVEAGSADLDGRLPADVSLIAHVGYDVEQIWPFVAAMERATRRLCLAVLMERSPASLAEPFWIELHGERRVSLPALPAFTDLLAAHGRAPSVRMLQAERRTWSSRDELERFVRRQTWVAAGSAKDRRLGKLLDEWVVEAPGGGVDLSVAEPLQVGLVAWTPRGGSPPERSITRRSGPGRRAGR